MYNFFRKNLHVIPWVEYYNSANFYAPSFTISTILHGIKSVSAGGGGPASSGSIKDEVTSKEFLSSLAYVLKRFAGKPVEAFPAIVEKVVGAVLSFFPKLLDFQLKIHGL